MTATAQLAPPPLRARRSPSIGWPGRALLAVAFACALAVRLLGVADSPLTFHPTRQYLGLRIARAQFYAGRSDIPAPIRRAVRVNAQSAPQLEPRILEAAVVAGYHLLGGERIWLGGALSSLLWVVLGGSSLFLIARRLASDLAAVVALAFYLFAPYAIVASRTFQPDPAMVAFMLAAVLALLRHHDDPKATTLASAGLLAAMAILIKPTAVFVIMGAIAALAISSAGLRKGLLGRGTTGLVAITLAPAAVFYIHAIVTGTAASSNAETSFIPSLFGQAGYWRGWLHIIDGTVGVVLALCALSAIVLGRSREARLLIGGLFSGYLVYGLVFNYHIHTHDYYSLQLLPIIGLGLGMSADAAVTRVRRMQLSPITRPAVALTVAVLAGALLWSGLDAATLRSSPSPADVAAQSERIGELVSHSTHVVTLAPAYGWPLGFYGSISGTSWPSYASGDFRQMELLGEAVSTSRQRLDQLVRSGAEWFVVADPGELDRQPDLKPLLDSSARLAGEGDGFLVYDLRAS